MCDVAELQPDITYAEYLASSRQQDARDRARFVGSEPISALGAANQFAALLGAVDPLAVRAFQETFRAWQQLAAWADSLKGNQ